VTAKAVCDALLDLFVNVGVPKVIVSECGTNFTSQLTQEMLCKLGCALELTLRDIPRPPEWLRDSTKPARK